MADPQHDFRAAILAALGHAPEVIEPGKLHRFGTSDRRGDSSGWCKLFDDCRGGVFGDWRAGLTESWASTDRRAMTHQERAELARQIEAATRERDAAQRKQWAENSQRIARLWAQCVPLVPGDPVTLYLKARGLGGVWPLPECLRLHRSLPYWSGEAKLCEFAAMVAPLTGPDGRIVALHRTYLETDGRKADVPTVKKLTGTAGPLGGACIPLHKPARGVIGIAEGIETALASWCASGVPTVAAYSAGNLAAWHWPTSVQHVIVFADNDRAGREAADELRSRVLRAGLRCQVMTPTDAGTDWADVWASRKAVEVRA